MKKTRLGNFLIHCGVVIPFCLIFPTIQYKTNTFQSYKDIFFNFSKHNIDIWGVFTYISLVVAALSIVLGVRLRKKSNTP